MIIKVDMEKAYERLQGDFIRETLELAGIPHSLVSIIMRCKYWISLTQRALEWKGSR